MIVSLKEVKIRPHGATKGVAHIRRSKWSAWQDGLQQHCLTL